LYTYTVYIKEIVINVFIIGLQCFDAVGCLAGRASGLKKMNSEVLAWLSVWSKV